MRIERLLGLQARNVQPLKESACNCLCWYQLSIRRDSIVCAFLLNVLIPLLGGSRTTRSTKISHILGRPQMVIYSIRPLEQIVVAANSGVSALFLALGSMIRN